MRRARSPIVLLLLVVVASHGPVVGGCSSTHRASREIRQAEQARHKAVKTVTERSHEYLLAVRWQDFQMASEYYGSEQDKLAFLDAMTDLDAEHPVIESFRLDYTLVNQDASMAEVRVTFKEVDPTTQSLVVRTQSLLWRKTEQGTGGCWFLAPVVLLDPVQSP
jgi:type IV secretory pathway VirJ component